LFLFSKRQTAIKTNNLKIDINDKLSYGTFFTSSILDASGNTFIININKKSFTGSSTVITDYSLHPLNHQYRGGRDNEDDCIYGSEMTFEFYVNEDLDITDLLESDYKDFQMQVYLNGDLFFTGFVHPEYLESKLINSAYFISLTATDALLDLKDIAFPYTYNLTTGQTSVLYLVKLCLNETDIPLNINAQVNVTTSALSGATVLDHVYANANRFVKIKDGKITFTNCFDAISQLLTPFNAKLVQANGVYEICSKHEKNTSKTSYDWTSLTGTTTTYNRVNTNASLFSFNSDSLSKVKPYKAFDLTFRNLNNGSYVSENGLNGRFNYNVIGWTSADSPNEYYSLDWEDGRLKARIFYSSWIARNEGRYFYSLPFNLYKESGSTVTVSFDVDITDIQFTGTSASQKHMPTLRVQLVNSSTDEVADTEDQLAVSGKQYLIKSLEFSDTDQYYLKFWIIPQTGSWIYDITTYYDNITVFKNNDSNLTTDRNFVGTITNSAAIATAEGDLYFADSTDIYDTGALMFAPSGLTTGWYNDSSEAGVSQFENYGFDQSTISPWTQSNSGTAWVKNTGYVSVDVGPTFLPVSKRLFSSDVEAGTYELKFVAKNRSSNDASVVLYYQDNNTSVQHALTTITIPSSSDWTEYSYSGVTVTGSSAFGIRVSSTVSIHFDLDSFRIANPVDEIPLARLYIQNRLQQASRFKDYVRLTAYDNHTIAFNNIVELPNSKQYHIVAYTSDLMNCYKSLELIEYLDDAIEIDYSEVQLTSVDGVSSSGGGGTTTIVGGGSGVSISDFNEFQDEVYAYTGITAPNTYLTKSAFNVYSGTTEPLLYASKSKFLTYTGTTAPLTYQSKSSIVTLTGTTLPLTYQSKSSIVTLTGSTLPLTYQSKSSINTLTGTTLPLTYQSKSSIVTLTGTTLPATYLSKTAFNTYSGTTVPNTYLSKTAFNVYSGTTVPNTYLTKAAFTTYSGGTRQNILNAAITGATNGLSVSARKLKLGGSLTGSTKISIGSNNFSITGTTGIVTLGSSLYALSNGNTAVGTTSPDRLFHVELLDSANASIRYPLRLTHVLSNTPSTGVGVGVEFEQQASGGNVVAGAIDLKSTTLTASGETFNMVLKTIGAGTLADRVYVNSTGLGIGTTPSQALDVLGSVNVTKNQNNITNITINNSDTTDGTSRARFVANSGTVQSEFGSTATSNNGYVGTISAHHFNIRTNNFSRIHISSGGSVHIGSSAEPPITTATFHVNGSTVMAGGPVGIGELDAQALLHISGNVPRILLFDSDATIGSSNPAWSLRSTNATGAFILQTTADYSSYTDVMTVSNGGLVTLNITPTNDNTQANLLVRDSSNGQIKTRAASTFQSSASIVTLTGTTLPLTYQSKSSIVTLTGTTLPLTYQSKSSIVTLTGTTLPATYQGKDSELTALAGLTSAANKLPYFTGSGTASLADFSSLGRQIVSGSSTSFIRSTLGLAIGTNVQAFDAGLNSIAGLTTSADKMIYTTASDTYATTTLTSFARQMLTGATANAVRATLGVSSLTALQYTYVAFVSKNGNDSTGAVGSMDLPYATIVAALTALNALGTININNRGLCFVLQGKYSNNVTLQNYCDINLVNAEIAGIVDDGAAVDCKIYGGGKIQKLTVNYASTISVDIDEINNATNTAILVQTSGTDYPKLFINTKKINGYILCNNGWIDIKTFEHLEGYISPNNGGSLKLFFEADYLRSTTTVAPILFTTGTTNSELNIKVRRIDSFSTNSSAYAIKTDNNFLGKLILNVDEVVASGSSSSINIVSSSADILMNVGRVINRNGGNVPAITTTITSTAKFKLAGGTQLIGSGTGASISGSGNVVLLGNVYGKNANSGITPQVGTFTANSTYIV
jgi:hypothetical protein